MKLQYELRMISLGQLFTTIRSGSYEEDDSSLLANILDTAEKNTTPSMRLEQLMVVSQAQNL